MMMLSPPNLIFHVQQTRKFINQKQALLLTDISNHITSMASTLLLVTAFPLAAFSASVPLSLPATGERLSDPLSLLPQLESLSTESLNANVSNAMYDMPFKYPGLDLLETTNANIQCKGENFGFNLSRTSFSAALARIWDSTEMLSFGQRGQGQYDRKLPFRISSCKWTNTT